MFEKLSQFWGRIQGDLFPWLKEELGPLSPKLQELVAILELVRIEDHIRSTAGEPGRPPKDRAAIARAFVAKAVYGFSTTRMLLDRLHSDVPLRRICGFESRREIVDESTFSRAFA